MRPCRCDRLLVAPVLVAGILVGAVSPARAEAPAVDQRCSEPRRRAPTTAPLSYNNGLPALGTILMAGGAGIASGAILVGLLGTVAVVERANGTVQRVGLLTAHAIGFAVVMAGALLLGLAGFVTWFVAWLPPVTNTLDPCRRAPPRNG